MYYIKLEITITFAINFMALTLNEISQHAMQLTSMQTMHNIRHYIYLLLSALYNAAYIIVDKKRTKGSPLQ